VYYVSEWCVLSITLDIMVHTSENVIPCGDAEKPGNIKFKEIIYGRFVTHVMSCKFIVLYLACIQKFVCSVEVIPIGRYVSLRNLIHICYQWGTCLFYRL